MSDPSSLSGEHTTSDMKAQSKLKKLMQALLLEQQVRKKNAHKNEVGFHVTNDTMRLISYRQCYLWSKRMGKVTVTHASGVSNVDQDSPFIQWFSALIKRTVYRLGSTPHPEQQWASMHHISKGSCETDDKKCWDEWLHEHAVLVLFWSPQGECFGGIWFDHDKPFEGSDTMLLEQVSDAYAHALYMLDHHNRHTWQEKAKIFLWGTNVRRVLAIALVVIAFFPLRLSATAPAEIIPQNPYMVTAPMDAVVEEIMVEPNQYVKKNDVLVAFDDTQLRNKKEVAEKEIQILRTELSQASRQAFSEDKSKAQIALITAKIKTKSAEILYLTQRLDKMKLKAPHDGQVIFSDASELRGQPMRTGQRLMLLAEPQDSELLIRIPVDNMLQINHDVPARAFLNIAPLRQYYANIRYVSYQANADPDGLMTYKVKARFVKSDERPVIGLQGTAKVYGDYTILTYHLLRRPLAWLREKLGL